MYFIVIMLILKTYDMKILCNICLSEFRQTISKLLYWILSIIFPWNE